MRADFSTISKYRCTTVFVLIGLGPRAAVRPGAGTEDPRLAAHPQPPGLRCGSAGLIRLPHPLQGH